ncbi:TPA: YggS family pyridoxal phosphate-dependent enzyme [Streptococcus agalactiae]
MMNLQENKTAIFDNVSKLALKAGRAPESVHIVAVTKYVNCQTTEALIRTGVNHIGENRVDKFLEKYQALKDEKLTWHLIGSLQRRKVKDVINYVDYFHALDSVKLAAVIQKRAQKPVKCFLQVNISREDSKHGFTIEQIDDALNLISRYDKIELIGIMTMAPLKATKEEISSIFEETESLRKRLQARNIERMPFTELSMGMSRDYDIAIQNGSTFVRIGTSFFK